MDSGAEESSRGTVTPLTTFQTLAVSVRPAFYQKDPDHMRYTPFTTVGRFHEKDGRIFVPAAVNFHHAVNDGYHAEKYFQMLQEELDAFAGR